MKKKRQGFTVRAVQLHQHGYAYESYQVEGWTEAGRYRKRFKSKADAYGHKTELEVMAANHGEIVARNTRLSREQLAQAESAFARLGAQSLPAAIEWFLANYRPPVAEMGVGEAAALFVAERRLHVRPLTLRDYESTLRNFGEFAGAKKLHEIKPLDVEKFLSAGGVGKKRWNNLRGDLNAFFEFARSPVRQWLRENPVASIAKFKISRGIPEILSAERCAELMKYVEEFRGGKLVPYFALALFAGLRPSVREGEIWKIGQLPDASRVVDVKMKLIRLSPDVAKTKSLRQIKIQPNLAAWLEQYQAPAFPIWGPGMENLIGDVRKHFALSDDILRHTWVSMHVAAFQSLGGTALEAGNSETIIRRHYLNMVSEADALAFWKIRPGA